MANHPLQTSPYPISPCFPSLAPIDIFKSDLASILHCPHIVLRPQYLSVISNRPRPWFHPIPYNQDLPLDFPSILLFNILEISLFLTHRVPRLTTDPFNPHHPNFSTMFSIANNPPVNFDDPRPASEPTRDTGKREILFGVPFSFNFDVAFCNWEN